MRIIRVLAIIVTLFVAIEHIGFLVLEMFYWDHPVGRQVFDMSAEVSASSAALAANQGLYNGFLAAGLLWGLIASKRDVLVFFLACVIVAGLFGAATASASILYIQAAPALAALVLVFLSGKWGKHSPYA